MLSRGRRRLALLATLSVTLETPTAGQIHAGDERLPLFVTFDSGIPTANISSNVTPFVGQEKFVWGAQADAERLAEWRTATADVKLSYYMPYSRAPAASLGFDLSFWQREHPDWILCVYTHRCAVHSSLSHCWAVVHGEARHHLTCVCSILAVAMRVSVCVSWCRYQCDKKTVAFWDGETAPTGSVPLDFTNPEVVAWQASASIVRWRSEISID